MSSTILDVAKAAGVSTSTVSRVLSGSASIGAETKARVIEAVRRLEYRPNSAARNLASRTSKALGLVINAGADQFVHNPFFISAMAGISQLAQTHDYNVLYAFNPNEQEDLEIATRFVSGRAVDGVILFTSRIQDKCIKYLREQKFPFSVIGRPDKVAGILWVDNDNFQATYQATDLLIARGHKSIAFIGGPEDLNMTKDRYDGYRRAFSVHGLYPEPAHVFIDGAFTEEFGHECMQSLLLIPDTNFVMPTAVITSDDLQAIGVLQALREKRRLDIAVIGFNNTGLGAHQYPALSSIEVNAGLLGYHAARLLIHSLSNPNSLEDHVIVPTQLIERASLVSALDSRKACPV